MDLMSRNTILRFNGTSTSVILPLELQDEFTITAWIKLSSTSKTKSILFDFAYDKQNVSIYFLGNSVTKTAELVFHVNPNKRNEIRTSVHEIDDSWRFIYASYNPKNGIMLQSGNSPLVHAEFKQSVVKDTATKIVIGSIHSPTTSDNNFGGEIANVKVWNKFIGHNSAIQIDHGLDIERENLVGFWPLKGTCDTIAVDISGNQRHAIIRNPTWTDHPTSIEEPYEVYYPKSYQRGWTGASHWQNNFRFPKIHEVQEAYLVYRAGSHGGPDSSGKIFLNSSEIDSWSPGKLASLHVSLNPNTGQPPDNVPVSSLHLPVENLDKGINVEFRYTRGSHGVEIFEVFMLVKKKSCTFRGTIAVLCANDPEGVQARANLIGTQEAVINSSNVNSNNYEIKNPQFVLIECPKEVSENFLKKSMHQLTADTRVAVLVTPNLFNYQSFLELVRFIIKENPHEVVLIHDTTTCKVFPPKNVPDDLVPLFENSVVRLIPEYSRSCWKKLCQRFGYCPPDAINFYLIHNHKEPGAALELYYKMAGMDLNAFMDNTHELSLGMTTKLIAKSAVVVLILSDGFFDNDRCLKEFQAAIASNRPLIVVRHVTFAKPEEKKFHEDWNSLWKLQDKFITFDESYAKECAESISVAAQDQTENVIFPDEMERGTKRLHED